MSYNTGKDLKTIEQDTERDYFLTADEALQYGIIDKIIGRALEGMTTVIIITIFIVSIIMISLGIIGYYIARIYEEIKGRPKYIISSTTKSISKN